MDTFRHCVEGEVVAVSRASGWNCARPGAAERALARSVSPDRGELSRHRRTCGLAQPLASHSDDIVAGFGAQRYVGPGAARPHLCAAYLGGAAADRNRTAVFR